MRMKTAGRAKPPTADDDFFEELFDAPRANEAAATETSANG